MPMTRSTTRTASTQWWPISVNEKDGWVAGFYLRIDGYGDDAQRSECPADAASTADEASAIGGEQ